MVQKTFEKQSVYKKNNRIDSLQWLRAIAAFWVLITHVYQQLGLQPRGYIYSGQWGVDVFFILSGFIIFFTTEDGSNWKEFAKKRVLRIFPLYLSCLVLYYLFFHLTANIILPPLQWFQNILMMPFSEAIGYHSLLVGQAWSTCYELYFYFMITLLLLLGIKKQWLVPLLLGILVIGLGVSRMEKYTQCGFVRYIISLVSKHHNLMFVLGVVISIILNKITPPILCDKSLKRTTYCLIGFSVLIIVYALMLRCRYNFYLSLGISAIIFMSFFIFQSVLEKTGIINRIMTYLGDISYSVYLLHYLIIRILIIMGLDEPEILLPSAIVCTVAISSMTYFGIEKPFIRLSKRQTKL